MKALPYSAVALVLALILGGCDQQSSTRPADSPTTTSPAANATDDHGDHDHDHDHDEHAGHDHGKVVAAGTVAIGSRSVGVELKGTLQPGSEAFIDVTLADKPAAKALRAWIGSEDASQTGKTLLELNDKGAGHGHVEVPKPLDPAHRLWLEVEDEKGKQVGSLALAAAP